MTIRKLTLLLPVARPMSIFESLSRVCLIPCLENFYFCLTFFFFACFLIYLSACFSRVCSIASLTISLMLDSASDYSTWGCTRSADWAVSQEWRRLGGYYRKTNIYPSKIIDRFHVLFQVFVCLLFAYLFNYVNVIINKCIDAWFSLRLLDLRLHSSCRLSSFARMATPWWVLSKN